MRSAVDAEEVEVAKKKESRKTRRNQASRERAREAHVRLILERQGDPRYVQQTRTPTGRTLSMTPEVAEAINKQLEAFREKFGREPGPHDPLIFDPDSDEPVPLSPDDLFSDVFAAAREAGIDSAYISAWEELGYIITEENQHLFSAHEVEAYFEAVERAQDEDDGDGEGGSVDQV